MAVLRQQIGLVKIDRWMHERAVLVDVHDADVFAARTGLQILPRNPQLHLVEERGLEAGGDVGIDAEHAQLAEGRTRDDLAQEGTEWLRPRRSRGDGCYGLRR